MTDSQITANYNEVLGTGNPIAESAMPLYELLTSVKNEVMYGGQAPIHITSTKTEVLYPSTTNARITTNKLEVMYNDIAASRLNATKVEVMYSYTYILPRRSIVFVNKSP